MTDIIALGQPTFGEEEVQAVAEVLRSGWVAGQGPRGRLLEERFAELTGTTHAVAVNNCTAALHLALLAHEVGAGDEILVADYTYPATGHAVLFTGARPVFVDVRADTGTIAVEDARRKITPRTRGIIAVDVFGLCADWDELRALADDHGLFLIEDAAAGAGATYRGRPAGQLGDVACFSFHGRKGITSGEGGILVTDDRRLADRARKLSCFGVESAFARQASDDLPVPVFDLLGYNYKLSDINAAIVLVQLERLPALLKVRREVADRYARLLGDVPHLELPACPDDREHTWQTYPVTVGAPLDRGRLAARLRAEGVQANIGTFASHLQPVYVGAEPCPTSARVFATHLAIPMHANLTEADVDRAAATLRAAVDAELREGELQ
jgi:perosamine synthetase